jgi:glycosyltransferase involved in cell wall biosynthesis
MTDDKKYHKKTILQVVPALISGGVERGTLEIAKKLVATGYNSIVISAGGPMVESLIAGGSTHIQMDVSTKNPFYIWKNARHIADEIRKHNVDIIHARSRAPAWSCYIAAKATGIKLITTFHGVYNFSNIIKKFYNSIMTEGQKVIAVSNFIKDHIIQKYKTDEDKIVVIHRGVNHEEFSMSKVTEDKINEYREKYRAQAGTPVLLLPSRMTEWKGHLVLVQALSKIKDQNFYCILAGDLSKHPKFVSRVKELIERHRMQGKIQLFGNEPDIRALYAISDIVLSTSTQPEAFGRTIIEAQSMEKLVIATNIGGASETIQNEINGFHVLPGDADLLAEKIKYCLSIIGTEKAKEITARARSDVSKNFSLELMLDKSINVYKEVLSN